MQPNLTYKFYLPENEATKPLGHVYLRILVCRKKAELGTGVRVRPADWEQARQRAKRAPRENEELSHLENRLLDLKRDLMMKDKELTAKLVRDLLKGSSELNPTVVEYVEKQIGLRSHTGSGFKRSTIEGYGTLLRHLKAYCGMSKYGAPRLRNLDATWLEQFDRYLLTTTNKKLGRAMTRNGSYRLHGTLKGFLNKAVREELLDRNPYLQFQVRAERVQRHFLTQIELDHLAALDLAAEPELEASRDLFLFSAYCGLHYRDAQQLRPHQLKQQGSRWWLELVQEKTSEPIRLPLLAPAVRILLKYRDLPQQQITGHLLPQQANNKLNPNLRLLCLRAGIEKVVTHHVARHTFATTVTLSNRIPIEAVSKLLGHRDIQTTQIYARITNEYLANLTDELNRKLG